MNRPFDPYCKRYPDQISEYVALAQAEGYKDADEAVKSEEGTYNYTNGHFACTDCYIKLGQPSRPFPGRGWKAQ